MAESESSSIDSRGLFSVPFLPKAMFWFDFVVALLVAKIVDSSGDPLALLIVVPLLANILLLLKVKEGIAVGYLRSLVVIGFFFYAIRSDLGSLKARQMVLAGIVVGYNVVYALMVMRYASALRRWQSSGIETDADSPKPIDQPDEDEPHRSPQEETEV